jgi:voltage-gated potassium channel
VVGHARDAAARGGLPRAAAPTMMDPLLQVNQAPSASSQQTMPRPMAPPATSSGLSSTAPVSGRGGGGLRPRSMRVGRGAAGALLTEQRDQRDRRRRERQATLNSLTGQGQGQVDPLPTPPRGRRGRSVLHRLLSHRSHVWYAKLFNWLLMVLIMGNVAAFVVSTVPSVGDPYEDTFYVIEAVSSSLFLLEYTLRVYVAAEEPRLLPGGSPTAKRLRYMVTFRALIDAAATFPFFIELVAGLALPNTTYLRALRVFRILKTERFVRALSSIYRVLWYNSEILAVGAVLSVLLMFGTSVLLFYLRPNDGEQFASIPACFYLALLMLCGQGEPEGELPW